MNSKLAPGVALITWIVIVLLFGQAMLLRSTRQSLVNLEEMKELCKAPRHLDKNNDDTDKRKKAHQNLIGQDGANLLPKVPSLGPDPVRVGAKWGVNRDGFSSPVFLDSSEHGGSSQSAVVVGTAIVASERAPAQTTQGAA